MQSFLVVLLAFCMQVSAAAGYSQRLTIKLENVPLQEVIRAIEKQTSLSFFYDEKDISAAKAVSIDVKSATIEEVLEAAFKPQNFSWLLVKKNVMIKKSPEITGGLNPRLQEHHFSDALPPPPITVRGRITNENGEPVIASVTIKGTNKGTTSDVRGEFELNNINSDAVLIISATNIETVLINVNNQSNLSITVKNASASLNEVIVNKGYYSESRKLSTGNVATVDAKTIEKQPISNPLQAIQGRMAGVYVQQNSGVPGGGFSIQIRGLNSLRSEGNDPLYIVDGIPFSSTTLSQSRNGATIVGSANPLNAINPGDIQAIEILKDADATAIYGSRGANGVVLITTKSSLNGADKLTLNFSTGIGKVGKMIDMMNTKQYLEMRLEAIKNDGLDGNLSDPQYNSLWPDITLWDTSRYTNWQKELIGGTSNYTNGQIGFYGGNDKTQFKFGGTYHRETTVFPTDFSFQRGSGELQVNHSMFNKKLNLSLSNAYIFSKNNLPDADQTSSAINLAPNAPALYKTNGSLNWENSTWGNPLALLKRKYTAITANLISNSELKYELIKNLFIKANFGFNTLQLDETKLIPISSLNPAGTNLTGINNSGTTTVKTWIIEPQTDYSYTFKNSKINILVGATFQKTTRESKEYEAYGYTSDALLENLMAAPSFFLLNDNYTDYKYNAIYSRINYSIKNKYIINLTGRRDGSSRFSAGNQFANFASIGTAWIFSEESFFKNLDFLNFGKIRLSYGSTGSDQIGDYMFLDSYNTVQYPYNGIATLAPTRLANNKYSWETNKKFEIGLESSFFNESISFSASYYKNRSSNQLVGYPLPLITGQESIQFNFPAIVQNSGIELVVNTKVLEQKNFKWAIYGNLTVPKNKLYSFPNIETFSSYSNQYVIGKPLAISKTLHSTGVDPVTGLYTSEDVDENSSFYDYPADFNTVVDRSQKLFGGIGNTVQYRNWSLDFLFQFVKQRGYGLLSLYSYIPGTDRNNQPTEVMERWRKPGDVASVQKLTTTYADFQPLLAHIYHTLSDDAFVDASFIRLKNISLYWTVPRVKIKNTGVSNIKFYVQAQNLLTFSNYLGLDPESQSLSLPPLRTIVAGFQISL